MKRHKSLYICEPGQHSSLTRGQVAAVSRPAFILIQKSGLNEKNVGILRERYDFVGICVCVGAVHNVGNFSSEERPLRVDSTFAVKPLWSTKRTERHARP